MRVLVLVLMGCGHLDFAIGDDGGSQVPDAGFNPATTYVKASNTGAGDQFGSLAVSGDGNTLAVGAPFESGAGAVYVFARSGSWSQQLHLKAFDAGDALGVAVALSDDGNTLAVGAPGEASAATGIDGNQADNSAAASGAVYVFVRSSAVWTQQAYIKASNTGAGDRFGTSLALSANGETLAVGAYTEDGSGTAVNAAQNDNAGEAGAVYVFQRSSNAWSQPAYIKATNTNPGDQFGFRLALSQDGNALAVGAPTEDSGAIGINGNQLDNTMVDAGAAYVYTRGGSGQWTSQAYVKASNTAPGDWFGGGELALSADGNTLVVGSLNESSSATGVAGNQSDNSAPRSGAAYVYTRSGTVWMQQAYVKAFNTGAQDQFGSSLALSFDGNALAVGANFEDSAAVGLDGDQANDTAMDAGAVYLFVRGGTTWAPQQYIKASNTDAEDQFGASVRMSGDGSLLAVGAPNESSAATGIGGDQSDNSAMSAGAVYLYQR